jgi:hypothetical protein
MTKLQTTAKPECLTAELSASELMISFQRCWFSLPSKLTQKCCEPATGHALLLGIRGTERKEIKPSKLVKEEEA